MLISNFILELEKGLVPLPSSGLVEENEDDQSETDVNGKDWIPKKVLLRKLTLIGSAKEPLAL